MCKLTAPKKDKHLIITWQKPVLTNQLLLNHDYSWEIRTNNGGKTTERW